MHTHRYADTLPDNLTQQIADKLLASVGSERCLELSKRVPIISLFRISRTCFPMHSGQCPFFIRAAALVVFLWNTSNACCCLTELSSP